MIYLYNHDLKEINKWLSMKNDIRRAARETRIHFVIDF